VACAPPETKVRVPDRLPVERRLLGESPKAVLAGHHREPGWCARRAGRIAMRTTILSS